MKRLKPNQPITYYHAMSRAAQQKMWLEALENKQLFLEQLVLLCQIFYVDCLAFTIMGTHFHLCLAVKKPPFDEADIERRYELSQRNMKNKRPFHSAMARRYYDRFTDLSMFMGQLKWQFSIKHNARMKTKGTFWEGRFKSIVIENSTYLVNCMSYLELNPVRAKVVSTPDAFAFSSVHQIRKALESGKPDPTPAVGCLADIPDGDRGRAYVEMNRFLARKLQEEQSLKGAIPKFLASWIGAKLLDEMLDDFKQKAPSNWRTQAYGSEAFATEILERAKEPKPKRKPGKKCEKTRGQANQARM